MAFAGLQELPCSGVWLEETKGDVMAHFRSYAWHSPATAQFCLFPLFSYLAAELWADIR